MEKKIKDLTVQELRDVVSNIVKETMEEFIEDMLALSSKGYLLSIEEPKGDEGIKVKQIEETFDA